MLLSKLAEYEKAEAAGDKPEEALPPRYNWIWVQWIIDLDERGGLLGFISTVGDDRTSRKGKRIAAPDALITIRVVPKLLAQKADYALGLAPDGADPKKLERVAQCHEAFIALVRECGLAVQEPAVRAVQRFLESFRPDKDVLPKEFSPGDVVTFRVAGDFPINLPRVRMFWANRKEGEDRQRGQCLVCGEEGAISRIHEIKIKGIPEGHTAGTSLVSFNAKAFESYGLEQSYGAPVCDECAEGYAKGLNRLIQGEDTSLRIGLARYVFWTRERAAFNPAKLLGNPEPQDVQALLQAVHSSRVAASQVVKAGAFYAMSLSASGGRAVVRDWLETTVEAAQGNIARFFRMQQTAPLYGDEVRYFSLRSLVQSLVPEQRPGQLPPNPPPNAATALLRAALLGGALPEWLLFQAVRRNRAEQGPLSASPRGGLSWARVALIKLVLQSGNPNTNSEKEGRMDTSTELTPAFLCGRLLALVEHAQASALGDPNATVVDRFYGSASSAPASVFGLLLRNMQHHLSKAKDLKPGIHYWIQRDIEEVVSGLTHLPSVLSLKEQGLFALGYYYQRAANYRKRERGEPSEGLAVG